MAFYISGGAEQDDDFAAKRRPRALDLFCGAGGASMGLCKAGFEVFGVDIKPQKNYPFWFLKADALNVDLMGYDFIWASPPCQFYSDAQRIRNNDHPDLIAAIRDRLRAAGVPYCIENVPGARRCLINPIELCGLTFGLKTYRHRLFETSFPCAQPMHKPHEAPQAKMGRKPKDYEFIHVVGNFSDVKMAREAMGIWWMARNELSEAIPPAYSEYIGTAAIECRERSAGRYRFNPLTAGENPAHGT